MMQARYCSTWMPRSGLWRRFGGVGGLVVGARRKVRGPGLQFADVVSPRAGKKLQQSFFRMAERNIVIDVLRQMYDKHYTGKRRTPLPQKEIEEYADAINRTFHSRNFEYHPALHRVNWLGAMGIRVPTGERPSETSAFEWEEGDPEVAERQQLFEDDVERVLDLVETPAEWRPDSKSMYKYPCGPRRFQNASVADLKVALQNAGLKKLSGLSRPKLCALAVQHLGPY